MRLGPQLLQRTLRQNAALAKRCDAIANSGEAVEIMCHHEDGQPKRVAQGRDQFIEITCADGVKAGSRFVEKDDLRVERQGACEGLRA